MILSMIKIYREEISPKADRIEAEFRDMILGYDREIITPTEAIRRFGPQHSLPVITNNEKVLSRDCIPVYVEELRNLMQEWQAFQGDWCYINDMGEVC
jgi:hypothetical protein